MGRAFQQTFRIGRTNAAIVSLFLILVLVRFCALDDFPLIDPSEGRYGEIAREMATSGDWIVPQFETGQPFWGKPPLYFWASAFAIKLFGTSAATVRLPSLLFNLLTLVVVYLLAQMMTNRNIALLSVVILFSSTLFYSLSGLALVDTALTFFVTATVGFFYFAWYVSSRSSRHILLSCAAVAVAGSILSKGLIALVIIIPVLLVQSLRSDFQRSHGDMDAYSQRDRFCTAIAVILAGMVLSVPWHVMAELRSPGFARYYLLGEHFERFVQPGWKSLYGRAHREPYGMALLFLLVGFFPWSVLALFAVVKKRKELLISRLSSETVLLLAWGLPLPIIFAVTRGVMAPYLLPVLPAWAILVARLYGREPLCNYILSKFCLTAVLAPLGFSFASAVVLPVVAAGRSEELMIEAVRQLDTDSDSDLVYWGTMPYSADFYGNGTITNLVDGAALKVHLEDAQQDYFVTSTRDAYAFQSLANLGILEPVLITTKEALYREHDCDDAEIASLKGRLPSNYRLQVADATLQNGSAGHQHLLSGVHN